MKTPDKIYMTTSTVNKIYGNNWGCWTDRECPGEIYIRKEALLEWIQEVRAIPHENAITRDLALQEVVNKLNSM